MSAVLKPGLTRDAFMPRQPRGLGLGLVLALLAHATLIVALAFGVNWRASEPQGVEAELWSAVPQAAAPRAAETEPTPTPAQPPTPEPKPVVKAEAKPDVKPDVKPEVKRPEPVAKPLPVQPDPQIAIEQAKREQAKRNEAKRQQALDEQRARDKKQRETEQREKQQREKDQREAAEREQQRAEADRKKREADSKDKAEAAKLAAAREANLKRMMGQAGATGGPTATGTAAQSSGPSAGYAGRIMAQIKRNIVFNDSVPGNPIASVELRLAADGTIVSRRLLKSSGSTAWDDAVLRAIDKTAVLPRDVDGRVPSLMQIDSRPYE